MKLAPVTELDMSKKATLQKFDDYVIPVNCDVIVIFTIYDQFGANRKPDSGRMVCKTYIFIKSNFLSYKNKKQN